MAEWHNEWQNEWQNGTMPAVSKEERVHRQVGRTAVDLDFDALRLVPMPKFGVKS